MKRLFLFLGGLGWGARLQVLVVAVILGIHIEFDIKRGRWPVSIGVFLAAWIIGWLLKSVMAAHPRGTGRVWNLISLALLAVYVFVPNKWWRMVGPYFAREFFLWLDLSIGYWLVSELRLQQQRQIDDALRGEDRGEATDPDRFDFPKDDFGERGVSAP